MSSKPEPAIISRARAHRDKIAIRTDSNQYSYVDLLTRSADIAGELLDAGHDLHEARVALLVPAGFDYVTTQWGIWRAGGVAVPLSMSATEPELEYTLTDSQARCVVALRDTADGVKSLCSQHGLRLIIVDDLGSGQAIELPEVGPDRRAMILYTSGTTSRPKGVVSTHANIETQITALIDAWQWQRTDSIPLFLPLHHIHGIINVMSCSLWSGATFEPFAKFDLALVTDRVAEAAYSLFMAVPTIYVKLIQAIESMHGPQRENLINGFRRMRLMVSGSAALPVTVHHQWTSLTGQILLERYGMTEIGMALSNPYDGERRAGAVGQPLPGVEVRLVSESGTVIEAEDEPGQIQVRGSAVFCEYWNRPTATSESFVNGWFKTGDIAVREDGYYRIMGRQSVDIIKSGGYKLSALEIESVLLQHAAIAECAVVGIEDSTWGEAVAVALVTEPGQQLDLETLRDWCRDKLSQYKLPKQLQAVKQLPRNAMGKVTKPTVQELFK
jgi:malonyl-CoA/methylmalonyl-CoA synthetase